MDQDLHNAVQKILPPPHNLANLEKLFGEASYREYFRAATTEGTTFILMKIPEGKQSVSEEITNYQGEIQELPFLNVARYFNQHQIPAPQVIATDLPHGLILLQDLGDQNLEQLVQASNPSMMQYFYRMALDLLVRLQKVGQEFPDKDCLAFHRSFDQRLLLWELEHFLEYGIEDRFQNSIKESDRRAIMAEAQRLVGEIIALPYGLTHRDFQSRNLLFFGYEFYLIDFQDALMGPPHYDLVALLRDSYVVLPEEQLQGALKYYHQKRGSEGLDLEPLESFQKNFYRVTLQRKLKDAGRFQFIHTVKNNSKFLSHTADTLGYVKHAFSQLPEYEKLWKLLQDYVPELKP